MNLRMSTTQRVKIANANPQSQMGQKGQWRTVAASKILGWLPFRFWKGRTPPWCLLLSIGVYFGCQLEMALAKKETPPRISRIPSARIAQSGKPTNSRTRNGPLRFPAKALYSCGPSRSLSPIQISARLKIRRTTMSNMSKFYQRR